MPKRFTDTEKWKKPFIKSLQTVYKLFWVYLLDECDHAGIWHVEPEIASIRIGEKIDINEAKKQFEKKIVEFDEGSKWFIPDFISFQYGILNPEVKAHTSVISLLRKYNLEPFVNCLQTVKDKDKEQDKDMVKEKEPTTFNEVMFKARKMYKPYEVVYEKGRFRLPTCSVTSTEDRVKWHSEWKPKIEYLNNTLDQINDKP